MRWADIIALALIWFAFAIDAGQTIFGFKHGFQERNPILKWIWQKRESPIGVYTYFGLVGLLFTAFLLHCESNFADIIVFIVILVEGLVIYDNWESRQRWEKDHGDGE